MHGLDLDILDKHRGAFKHTDCVADLDELGDILPMVFVGIQAVQLQVCVLC